MSVVRVQFLGTGGPLASGGRLQTCILMAPPASPILLGAITLEGLSLGVDTLARRLIPFDFVYVA